MSSTSVLEYALQMPDSVSKAFKDLLTEKDNHIAHLERKLRETDAELARLKNPEVIPASRQAAAIMDRIFAPDYAESFDQCLVMNRGSRLAEAMKALGPVLSRKYTGEDEFSYAVAAGLRKLNQPYQQEYSIANAGRVKGRSGRVDFMLENGPILLELKVNSVESGIDQLKRYQSAFGKGYAVLAVPYYCHTPELEKACRWAAGWDLWSLPVVSVGA